MTDIQLLENIAQIYKKITQYTYILVIAKNNETTTLTLKFTASEFKHLAGLHKAIEFPDIYRKASAALLRSILSGKFPIENLRKSKAYPIILERWKYLLYLEEYLNSFDKIYEFDQALAYNAGIQTKIDAKYMIALENNTVFLFFIQDDNGDIRISDLLPNFSENIVDLTARTFVVGNPDYTKGQKRPAIILYKAKQERKTEVTEIQIDKLTKSLQNTKSEEPSSL